MKLTVKFTNTSGEEIIATFDREAGTVTAADGRKGTYTRPEGSRVLEIKGDTDVTITFTEDLKLEAGAVMAYSDSLGKAGKAEVLKVEA